MSRPPRILDLAATVTLIAALIYTAGWSYAYHWYDRFELGLIGLGIPFEYHFMYGFWVFQWFWWLVLTIAGFELRKQGKGRIAVDGWIETDDWFQAIQINGAIRVVPLDNFMIYKDIIRLDRPD